MNSELMTHALQLLAITGILFLSVLSPGPNFALVTSTAMTVSRRAGILTGLGLAAASCTWVLLAVAGLGLITTHFPLVHTAVQIAGAAYLIWLGVKMVMGAAKPLKKSAGGNADGMAAARKAFLVSMTNPKSIGFYGSIFTVMVPSSAPLWFYAAIVVMATLVSAGWYCGLAVLFSHRAALRIYARAKTAVEATMGLLLIALGGKLLLGR
ncbi:MULTISPECIES: LysE family transporter [unclassified Herbaspirillum]|uniref:LysE family translocator n=1 Tax=unclassified Herbaspirillum TaxID=2624150 RepID=UPI001F3DAAAC|nr:MULTISPECIES: LysE family transporter [unclassified Herbaspirillum]